VAEKEMNQSFRHNLSRIVWNALGFSALWFILCGDDYASWVIGIPAVTAAAWMSIRLQTGIHGRLNWQELFRFLPFFLWQSFRGSIDVAIRALHPGLPLQPAFVQYRLELPEQNIRVLFANIVSLLPGTLTADLSGNSLKVHTLSGGKAVLADLKALEQRINGLFIWHAGQKSETTDE
jgi:multicomponent Na+:H+ antiporter subunit E